MSRMSEKAAEQAGSVDLLLCELQHLRNVSRLRREQAALRRHRHQLNELRQMIRELEQQRNFHER